MADLKAGDPLRVFVDLNNPATRLAVSLATKDYQMNIALMVYFPFAYTLGR